MRIARPRLVSTQNRAFPLQLSHRSGERPPTLASSGLHGFQLLLLRSPPGQLRAFVRARQHRVDSKAAPPPGSVGGAGATTPTSDDGQQPMVGASSSRLLLGELQLPQGRSVKLVGLAMPASPDSSCFSCELGSDYSLFLL